MACRLVGANYLNQCWNIVNWTLRNKLQWNLNQNSYIFIQENVFENVVWKMSAILSRPQCVKRPQVGHPLPNAINCNKSHYWLISLTLLLASPYWPHTMDVICQDQNIEDQSIFWFKPRDNSHRQKQLWRQNGRRFEDDLFICILMNEKFCILIEISLKFVPKGQIDDNPALV